jgi:Mg-chelatase subunit ChlD
MAKTKTKKDETSSAAKDAAKKQTGNVHLFILMDESGSMSGLEEAVVTGCNEFLHAFKDNKKARAWLGFFDWEPGEPRLRLKVEGKKVADVKKLVHGDYQPRGMTPLNDAIMDALEKLDDAVKEDESAFLAIITDGYENKSEASLEAVKKALSKREKKGWGFVYIGATGDAEAVAAGYGLAGKGQSFNFSATRGGVRGMSSSVTNLAGSYAAGGASAMASTASDLYDKTSGTLPDEDEDDEK